MIITQGKYGGPYMTKYDMSSKSIYVINVFTGIKEYLQLWGNSFTITLNDNDLLNACMINTVLV